jgi:hypothetical protein
LVKPGGMCCVIITAGASAGRRTSTSRVASVPPVEAPMKMIFSVDSRPIDVGAGAAAPAVAAAAAGAARQATHGGARGGADLVGDVVAQLPQAVGHADLGLGDEVHRAEFQRRSVTSAPRSVSVDTITTGIGRSRISGRKSMPSMRGISTSSVITSGLRSRIISRATSGSPPRRCTSCPAAG